MLTSKSNRVGKVVVCGMKGVGKTAILDQLVYGCITPDSELCPTIEDTYVASVDSGRGIRDTLRLFDTAGLQGHVQIPRYYLHFADGYVLVYDPRDVHSFEILDGIKNDIDKNKEKKEVCIIVIANMRFQSGTNVDERSNDHIDALINRVTNWCSKERIKHYIVNALERATLYEPFIGLALRLHPPPAKSGFPQLRQLTQKTLKSDNN